MNNLDSLIANNLISLIDKKIVLLQTYKTSLQWLDENAENSSNSDLYSELDLQNSYIKQLKELNLMTKVIMDDYSINSSSVPLLLATKAAEQTLMPQWNQALYLKLAEYNELLSSISELNNNVVNKVQCLSDIYRDKIKHIRGQKNIISNYQLFNKNATGIFFDYKEGNKK